MDDSEPPRVVLYAEKNTPIRVTTDKPISIEIYWTSGNKPDINASAQRYPLEGERGPCTGTEAAALQERAMHNRMDMVIAGYAKAISASVKPKTVKSQHRIISKIADRFGWEFVEDSNYEDLLSYLHDIIDEGLSGKTYNNHLGAIRAFFGWCVDAGKISMIKNPADALRSARYVPGDGSRAFSVEDMQMIIRAARDAVIPGDDRFTMDAAYAYAIAATTGLRKSELFGLEWKMLNEDERALSLGAEITKSGKPEQIYLEPETLEVLRMVREYRGLPAPARWDRIFPRVQDNRDLFKHMERAGVPRIDAHDRSSGWHSFRKGYLTMRARMGDGAAEIVKRARHATLDTTLKHYIDGRILQQQGRLSEMPKFFLMPENAENNYLMDESASSREEKSREGLATGEQRTDDGSAMLNATTQTTPAQARESACLDDATRSTSQSNPASLGRADQGALPTDATPRSVDPAKSAEPEMTPAGFEPAGATRVLSSEREFSRPHPASVSREHDRPLSDDLADLLDATSRLLRRARGAEGAIHATDRHTNERPPAGRHAGQELREAQADQRAHARSGVQQS